MRISIFIDKGVALRAAKDVWGRRVVEVPSSELTADERDILADYGDYTVDGNSTKASKKYPETDFFLEYEGCHYLNDATREHRDILRPIMTEPTPAVVHASLAALKMIRDAKAAAEAAEKASKNSIQEQSRLVVQTLDVDRLGKRLEANPNENVYWSLRDYLGGGKETEDVAMEASHMIDRDDSLFGRVMALRTARLEREKAEREAREEADKKAKEEAEAKFIAERDAWVAAHGSKRLQRMLDEDIECTGVYLDERLAMERPGWTYTKAARGEYDDARNPPEEAFTVLDEARKTEPEATMVHWKIEKVYEDGDYPDPEDSKYEWTGYCAVADFLGREIVFGHPDAETSDAAV